MCWSATLYGALKRSSWTLTDGRRLPFWEPPTPALAGGRIPGLFVSSGLPLLADSQSILQGGRHFESFNRLLNSVLLIGCLNNSEMFSPSAYYIDAPAGHSHINAQCIELKCMTGGASFGREQY
jgi:hypothetical protein